MPLRFIPLLMLIALPVYAGAIWKATETHGTTSPVTGTSPVSATPDTAKHLKLTTARAITVTVCAPSGQTLSGAGTLDNYDYISSIALWAYSPTTQLSLSSCSGLRCCTWELEVLFGGGKLTTWIPTGVTFSGGSSGLVVTMEAYTP